MCLLFRAFKKTAGDAAEQRIAGFDTRNRWSQQTSRQTEEGNATTCIQRICGRMFGSMQPINITR